MSEQCSGPILNVPGTPTALTQERFAVVIPTAIQCYLHSRLAAICTGIWLLEMPAQSSCRAAMLEAQNSCRAAMLEALFTGTFDVP